MKWATCNVGAEKPEESGDYFAWGETETKSDYSWSTYKYCKGSYDSMTKYCNNNSYGYNGYTDGKTILDLEDDAAHVNWGGNWRMPTEAEFQELIDKCTWEWTEMPGKKGYKVTSKVNGNSIFLPAAGLRWDSSLDYAGSIGGYWSSSLYESYSYRARSLCFDSDDHCTGDVRRFRGHSVRPVFR